MRHINNGVTLSSKCRQYSSSYLVVIGRFHSWKNQRKDGYLGIICHFLIPFCAIPHGTWHAGKCTWKERNRKKTRPGIGHLRSQTQALLTTGRASVLKGVIQYMVESIQTPQCRKCDDSEAGRESTGPRVIRSISGPTVLPVKCVASGKSAMRMG